MSIEAETRVSLPWDGRRVQGPTVWSMRPFAAARIALGRLPTEAATLVPTLFAIRGHAQAAAAALRDAGARPDGTPDISVWSVPLDAVQDTSARRELAPVRASHPSSAATAASAETQPMLSKRDFLFGAPRGDRGP